jgi:hypothetical protein
VQRKTLPNLKATEYDLLATRGSCEALDPLTGRELVYIANNCALPSIPNTGSNTAAGASSINLKSDQSNSYTV